MYAPVTENTPANLNIEMCIRHMERIARTHTSTLFCSISCELLIKYLNAINDNQCSLQSQQLFTDSSTIHLQS